MMGANIKITEGGRVFQFGPVDKIETALQGEGSCLWLPDSDVALGTKTVYKNGLYVPADDEKYGYSSVSVNVSKEAKSISGKDRSTGKYYAVTKDSSDNLIESSVPSEIRVTTAPAKTQYNNGEAIQFSGLVVTAYDSDGSVWTSNDYPNGIIPMRELSFPIRTARYDATSETRKRLHTSFLETNWPKPIITYPFWYGEWNTGSGTSRYTIRNEFVPNALSEILIWKTTMSGVVFYVASKQEENVYTEFETNMTTGELISTQSYDATSSFTLYDKTVNYTYHDWGIYPGSLINQYPKVGDKGSAPNQNTMWTVLYGDAVDISDQAIPVRWTRPVDKAVLQASFNVEVIAA